MWVCFCFRSKFIYIIFWDPAYKWYQMIFVFLWLTSLRMIISRSTHVAANDFILFCVIFPCIYVPHLLYSPVDWHLGCCYGLAVVNSAAVNTGVHVSFWITVFSRYMPRSKAAVSYGSSIFSFLRDLHIVLHSSYIKLYSPSRVGGFPFLHTFSNISCL